jgi:hypothetical protein
MPKVYEFDGKEIMIEPGMFIIVDGAGCGRELLKGREYAPGLESELCLESRHAKHGLPIAIEITGRKIVYQYGGHQRVRIRVTVLAEAPEDQECFNAYLCL